MNDTLEIIVGLLVLFSAFFSGWVIAHNVVSSECKKLGGFYVGTTVYECKVKEETK